MLVIIMAFVISALMGMGVGGGGLFVIYLTLCLGYEQILAQGTNLVFFILSVVASIFIHLKKRKINFFQVATMALFGTGGAIITSNLANTIDPKIPRIILGVLLVLSGILTIIETIKKRKKLEKSLYKWKNI